MFQEWLFIASASFIFRGKANEYGVLVRIMALSSQVLNQDTLHTAVQVGSFTLDSSHQYYFLLMMPRYPSDPRRVASLASCTGCGL